MIQYRPTAKATLRQVTLRNATFHNATASLLDFIFPSVCANCRRLGALLCAECEGRLSRLQEPLCLRCGRPVASARQLCGNCQQRSLPLQMVRASFHYAEPLDTIIHQFKYEGYFALAEPLARLMAASWPEWGSPIDVISPIPLHPKRQRQRGFNQSVLLGQHLCRLVGLPFMEDVLRRIRYTTPQVGLKPEERANNMQGAFAADPNQVAGHHVLLIDDVFTTGATMSAAADALLAAGARLVSGYCLASAS